MARAIRLAKTPRTALVVALALGAASPAIAAGISACVTVAPPDLPVVPPVGPIILQDAVRPPPSEYLTSLPADGSFIVPVVARRPFEGRAFVDFYPDLSNMGTATSALFTISVSPPLDGGVTLVSFTLSPENLGDVTTCHKIQFLVADGVFSDRNSQSQSMHTPGDSLGADGVTWFYAPSGASGCSDYDAGDGAYPPPPDAPFDGLLLTPDVVGPL